VAANSLDRAVVNSARDGQMDLCFVSCNEGADPVRYGEEGAELKGEAFSLLVHLCSNPHLWSQILVMTQRMRSWIQVAEMSFLQRGAGLSLRDRGRSSTIRGEELHHLEGAQSRAAAPPHRKESAEVVHLIRMPPGRRPRVRTRTHWRDYISHLKLGTPRDPPGGAGERDGCVYLMDLVLRANDR